MRTSEAPAEGMGDVLTTFCAAFTLLGAKLLYWNNQPVTFGSVFLTALISASTAHLLAAGDGKALATNLYYHATNATCAYQDYAAPLRFACSMASAGGQTAAQADPVSDFIHRFSEL